jgi:hypothetical protein
VGNHSLHAPTRANIPTSPYGSRRSRAKWNKRNWRTEAGISRSGTLQHRPRRKVTGKKADSARPLRKEKSSKSKSDRLVCRYCGSDDLAPSFIKRRDRRCRKCFSKRYGSAARARKAKVKKQLNTTSDEGPGSKGLGPFSFLSNVLGSEGLDETSK